MSQNIKKQLLDQLEKIEKSMIEIANDKLISYPSIHDNHTLSAKNLIHYLVLRKDDLKEIQHELHHLGLSSLASSESHIHRQLQAIRERLGTRYLKNEMDKCTYDLSKKLVQLNGQKLFGEKETADLPYLMVTFDNSFADNYSLVKNLIINGMSVARINCAHDDEATWSKMIEKIKKACKKTGKNCKIYMDLAGPKIRTKILSKTKKNGAVEVHEGNIIWLAEIQRKDIVICYYKNWNSYPFIYQAGIGPIYI